MVADRITAEARDILTRTRWSWLDRHGRLHLHAPGVRVDIDVPGTEHPPTRASTRDPIRGRSGASVAYWLCSHPGEALSPTKAAPKLGLAPSTISTAVSALRLAGLVEDSGAGVFPELFWELAKAWSADRTWLISAPDPARHGVGAADSSWSRTGSLVAAAYGAPVVTREGGPLELYIRGPVEISIALRTYGAAQSGLGAAAIAVAPVTAVFDDDGPIVGGWRAAARLAAALDLAQDRSRGREILNDWEVPGAVWR